MSEIVKYLGLRLIKEGWVAVLDCGRGPDNWNAASIALAVNNRIHDKQPVPPALRDATVDLENLHTGRDVRYYEEAR